MSEIFTGMIEKQYEVWKTPPPRMAWEDTQSVELRLYMTYKDKEIADEIIEAFKSCSVKAELRISYKPVDEVPLIKKEKL